MGIHFSHPEYLWLLPLTWGFFWWVARRSLADLDRARRVLSTAVRLLLVTLLVLALAGIQLVRPVHSLCTIFVVDVSDSIDPGERKVILDYIHRATARKRGQDSVALVAFGAEALLDHAAEDTTDIQKVVSLPGTSRTNIAAGIQLAMASFPPETGKQIVLFTDGNENVGKAVDQADLAVSNAVRISVVPLQRDNSRGEALLLSANAPVKAHQGAPFQISVLAESLKPTLAEVTLLRDADPVAKRSVRLPAGKTVVHFEQSVPKSGVYHYSALLETPTESDTIPDNNLADAYVRIEGKPAVLVVEDRPGDGAQLARALQANDMQAVLGGPDRLPRSLAECAQFDSVILANVPAWRMSPAQMLLLKSAVHDMGMGLAMLGGDQSFGSGGYVHTPIEEALPVDMTPKRQRQLPSLTLVIVIDISGSMTAEEDGVPKVRLAAEAAAAAIEMLQPVDSVCVMGFDTSPVYTVPMTEATNKERLIKQVHRLEAGGGGILCCSSLKAAYNAIYKAKTKVKHVILCPDAQDTEEQEGAIEVAQRMRRENITLSVIGFGQPTDPHVDFHRQLAAEGGGKAYLAERLGNLPQIFTRDVITSAKPLIVEEPFQPRQTDNGQPDIQNIAWDSAPPLLGYVQTAMKETPSARQLLASHRKDPVLATWTYGLGRSLAFTSDASNRWGAPWIGWPEYGTFWAQALRWTLRKAEQAHFQTSISEENGRATVTVEAVAPDGEYRNLLVLRAHVAYISTQGLDGPQATSETLQLVQTASGRYEGSFETRGTGVYQVTVEEHARNAINGMQTASLVIPYSPEYQSLRPNLALLTEVASRAHGVVNPKPEDIFGRLRIGARILRDLWVGLVALLAVLFVFDVALRRILLPWREIIELSARAMVRVWPTRKLTPAGVATAHSPVSTLLITKERVRQRQDEESTPAMTVRPSQEPSQHASSVPRPLKSATQVAAPAADTASLGTTNRLLAKKRERKGES